MVQGAVDAVDKDPRLLKQLQQSGRSTAVMRGTAAYYQAMHFGSIGDSAQQIEFLDKAIALQPTQPDYLIAMFRV